MVAVSLTIRVARPADFAEVERLTVAVYLGEGFTSPGRGAALRQTATRAAATELLVAVPDTGGLAGAVSYIGRGGPYRQIAGDDEGEVRLLAVARESRGQGTGAALVQGCIAAARRDGKRALVLSTQPSMLAAQRLYERLGFVRAAARDWPQASGVSMQVYSLDL